MVLRRCRIIISSCSFIETRRENQISDLENTISTPGQRGTGAYTGHFLPPLMAYDGYQSPRRPSYKNSADSSPESSAFAVVEPSYDDAELAKYSFPRRIWEGFKRDPHARTTPAGTIGADGRVFDVEGAAQATANSPLARRLKGRHLQMIAIGGSIGKARRLPFLASSTDHL